MSRIAAIFRIRPPSAPLKYPKRDHSASRLRADLLAIGMSGLARPLTRPTGGYRQFRSSIRRRYLLLIGHDVDAGLFQSGFHSHISVLITDYRVHDFAILVDNVGRRDSADIEQLAGDTLGGIAAGRIKRELEGVLVLVL